jgi:hypothetical protein
VYKYRVIPIPSVYTYTLTEIWFLAAGPRVSWACHDGQDSAARRARHGGGLP